MRQAAMTKIEKAKESTYVHLVDYMRDLIKGYKCFLNVYVLWMYAGTDKTSGDKGSK